METPKQEYRKHYLIKHHTSITQVQSGCRESVANYVWLYNLFEKLCDEYTFRYGKIHSTDLYSEIYLYHHLQISNGVV